MKGTNFTDNIAMIQEVTEKLTIVVKERRIEEKQTTGSIKSDYVPTLMRFIGAIVNENQNCLLLTRQGLKSFYNRPSYGIWESRELTKDEKSKLQNVTTTSTLYVMYLSDKTLNLLFRYKLITKEQHLKFTEDILIAKKLIRDLEDKRIKFIDNFPTIINGNYTIKNSSVTTEKDIPDFTIVEQRPKIFNEVPNNRGVELSLASRDVSFETGKITGEIATTNILMLELMFKRLNTVFGFEPNLIERVKDHLQFNKTIENYKGDTAVPMFYNLIKLVALIIEKDTNGIMIMRDDIGKLFGIKGYSTRDNHTDPVVLRFIMDRMHYHFGDYISIRSIEIYDHKGDVVDYKYQLVLSDSFIESLKVQSIISEEQYENFINNIGSEETVTESYINDFMKGKMIKNTRSTKKNNKLNDKDKALFMTWINEAISNDNTVILNIKEQLDGLSNTVIDLEEQLSNIKNNTSSNNLGNSNITARGNTKRLNYD